MIGYPFDSHVEYDEHDVPVFDRAISSVPLKNLIAKLFSNGVLPNPSTNLQVVSGGDGMTVIVKAGFCIINGGLKLEDEDKTLVVQASDSTYPRIDTVVMRWNDNDGVRACDLYIVEGTPSVNPVRPNLTRTESVYEIGLADIYITARSTSIDSFRITDTRIDTARCGYISSISEFDTSTLYAQIQSDLDNFQEVEQADFLAWFEEMRDQLSEDAAGNLQLQIDNVNGRYDGLTEDINAFRVVNQLPEVGAAGTLYLVTGEEETHFAGNVDDNKKIINDNVITTDSAFSSLHTSDLLNNKVDKEDGKGLSKNDFTDAHKTKLDGLPSSFKTINGESIIGTGNIVVQGGDGETMPSYYEQEFAETKAEIESHYTVDSFNIALESDLHFSAKGSGYNEGKLRVPLMRTWIALKKMTKEVPTRLLGFLGDYMQMDVGFTKEQGISNIAELNEYFNDSGCQVMAIAGNHEVHYRGNAEDDGLSAEEVYSYLMKKYLGNNIKKVSIHTFYWLDDVNEVCHVFLSTFSEVQTKTVVLADFASVATANTNDYPYIIYNHFGWSNADQTTHPRVKDCIDYIKNTLNGTIITWVAGHVHKDTWSVYNSTIVLTINNSGFYASSSIYPKVVGTANESAFTYMTVVPSTGKLFITRFGAGVNAEYNYNTTSGAIGKVEHGDSYNVGLTLNGGVSSSNTDETTPSGEPYTTTLNVPDENFSITNVVVRMDGIDITSTAYNDSTHVVSIPNVSGDVSIVASATNSYFWTFLDSAISPYSTSVEGVDYKVNGNNVSLTPSASNKGLKARMNLKNAITSSGTLTMRADEATYASGDGSNHLTFALEIYDSNDTKLHAYGFASGNIASSIEAGVSQHVNLSHVPDASYMILNMRASGGLASEIFPITFGANNLHISWVDD